MLRLHVAFAEKERLLLVVLTVYGLLFGLYSVSVPLFEGPDSYYHFAVIDYIHRTGELPPKVNPTQYPWQQMAFHAPLYYQISALLIGGVDTSDFSTNYPRNPHAQIGKPGAADNQNFVAHTGDPLLNTGLAVRIVRCFNLVLGLVTLVSIYWMGRSLFPDHRSLAVVSAFFVAVNPQYLFISSIVTNDMLVTALVTATLAMLVAMMRHRRITMAGIVALAVLSAFASLAKASGLIVYPAIIVGTLWLCRVQRVPLIRVVLYALVGLVIWLLIAGWWYFDNWLLFADWTASSQVAAATGGLRNGFPEDIIGELRGLYYSFWGLFGWFNIPAPSLYYTWTQLLVLSGMAGIAAGLWKSRKGTSRQAALVGVLGIYCALFLISWWSFHRVINAAQGRLLFPMLGVLAPLLAWGLSRWGSQYITGFFATGMFTAAILLPLSVIRPVYQSSAVQEVKWAPPEAAQAFHFREPWNEEACLTLWIAPVEWDGQSPISVQYWWQSDCAMGGYWSVFLHLINLSQETCVAGDTDYILAQADSMPDGGNTPTPALHPGMVLYDTMTVNPPPGLALDQNLYLQTGLYDAGPSHIRAFVSTESIVSPDLGIGQCAPESVLIRLKQ